jgi:hypothetical protein
MLRVLLVLRLDKVDKDEEEAILSFFASQQYCCGIFCKCPAAAPTRGGEDTGVRRA